MKRKKKSIKKGFERTKKIKDLEVAKELEIRDKLEENVRKRRPDQSTPKPRSDLPKE